MMTFVAIIHIIVAFVLIGLVLIQDSKGGGLGIGGGGGGSNSLLGAAGAQTLASKMTRWMAGFFAVTCISLTMMTAQNSRSVLDAGPLPTSSAPAAPGAAAGEAAVPAATTETAPAAETAPAQTAPAASENK